MENIIWGIAPIPLVLGIVIKMVIAGLWFSPLLFRKPWMKLIGLTVEEMKTEEFKKKAKIGYIGAPIFAITTSYIIGIVLQSLKIDSIGETLLIMLILFIGFIFPVVLSHHLWERRPWGLLPIDAGYEWLSYSLVGLLYIWF